MNQIHRTVWKIRGLKKLNVNVDADAIANANAGSSAIALPGLRPGELKNLLGQTKKKSLILSAFCILLLKKEHEGSFLLSFWLQIYLLSIYLFIIPSC